MKLVALLLLLLLVTPPRPSKEALDEERLRPEKFLPISVGPAGTWFGGIVPERP